MPRDDPYTDLRGPRPPDSEDEPYVYWRKNENAIIERLREVHLDDYIAGYDWGTWENIMRVRNGDEPRRPKDKNRSRPPRPASADGHGNFDE